MKRLIAILTLLFAFTSFSSVVQASEQITELEPDTPTILVILSGSLNQVKSVERSVYSLNTKKLSKTLQPYNLLIGDQYKQRLEDIGTPEVSSLERADLISIFADLNPDYIIVYEFLPISGGGAFSTMTSAVHLKVIDTALNTYIANKKFSYRSRWASIDGHYNEIYSNIESEVFSKHFTLADITPKKVK